MIINGKALAQKIIFELKKQPRPNKILAAVLVGNNAQSQIFLRQKEKIANEIGISFHLYRFNDSIPEEDLIEEVRKLSEDSKIGGIIIQLPLPRHYDRDRVLAAVDSQKDIDALTSVSRQFINPLSVEVVRDVLRTMDYKLKNKIIAVVGKGFLIGKPIAEYFKNQCQELIIFDSKSDLSELKGADLVITGIGKGGLIKPGMLKSGVAVIDFGYDIIEVRNGKGEMIKRVAGDFDTSNLQLTISDLQPKWYTPTPGGTGPILVAEIFKNFYKLNQR